MAAAGASVGLASEGSFGLDPAVPVLPVNHELLVFVDDDADLVVVEHSVTTDTNFDHADAESIDDLGRFLRRAHFPSGALIVRPRKGGAPEDTHKGISSLAELGKAIDRAARISTDGFALAIRLRSHCTACDTPGWGRVDVVPGLPCVWCGTPTDFIHYEIHGCPRCDHREHRHRSDGLTRAEPDHCPRCNA